MKGLQASAAGADPDRPVKNTRNSDGRVRPKLIGLRPDLLKHIEIVPMPSRAHHIEHTGVATRRRACRPRVATGGNARSADD